MAGHHHTAAKQRIVRVALAHRDAIGVGHQTGKYGAAVCVQAFAQMFVDIQRTHLVIAPHVITHLRMNRPEYRAAAGRGGSRCLEFASLRRVESNARDLVPCADEINPDMPIESEPDQVSENIEAVLEFYAREEQRISVSQRTLERLSDLVGQPIFLGFTLLFASWIFANVALPRFGIAQFDPPPFHWLQGILALAGLLIATVVLTRQNRLGKLAEQRAHLDLKVTLLTEQKATKLIDLLEELRRDLPERQKPPF